MRLPDEADDSLMNVVWALCHWCNSASTFHRQRDHVGHRGLQGEFAIVPDRKLIVANRIKSCPDGGIKHDDELDEQEALAISSGAGPSSSSSATLPAVPGKGRGKGRGRAAKARGRGRGSSGSSGSSSSSTSSSSSSSSDSS